MGLIDAEIPALETVGLATLGLLSGVATEATPLCVLLDDVHWLDDSTAAVVRFVWRRLSAEPIVLIAAGREGGWPAPGMVAELPVGPLGPAESESLLRSRAPDLSLSDYGVILAEAEGNPLGIVELAEAFRARSDRPRTALAPLPLTDRLAATFAGQGRPAAGADACDAARRRARAGGDRRGGRRRRRRADRRSGGPRGA